MSFPQEAGRDAARAAEEKALSREGESSSGSTRAATEV